MNLQACSATLSDNGPTTFSALSRVRPKSFLFSFLPKFFLVFRGINFLQQPTPNIRDIQFIRALAARIAIDGLFQR
eukprot:m.233980 g.233980  ORF g.233980 m.233980 type:complete len:76 (-) comp15745_c0_seq4:455-682(-)